MAGLFLDLRLSEGKMKRQKGYIQLTSKDIVFTLFIFAIIYGVVFLYLIPWIWGLIKPLIHSITG